MKMTSATKIDNNCREIIKSVGIDIDRPHLMISYAQHERAYNAIKEKIINKEVDTALVDFDFIKYLLSRHIALAHDVNCIDELIDFDRSFGSETTIGRTNYLPEDVKASNPKFTMWLDFDHKDLLGENSKLRYFYLRPSEKLVQLMDEYTLDGIRNLDLAKTENGFTLFMRYDQIIGNRKLLDLPKKGFLPLVKFLKQTTKELDLHAEKAEKLKASKLG